MKLTAALIVLAAAALPASGAMAASLIGATVSEQYSYPDATTAYGPTVYLPQTYTVGAGQESAVTIEGVTTFNIDFAAASLAVDFDTVLATPTFNSTSFNGLVFTSPAFAAIRGVSLAPATNLAGFDVSRVSIVGNSLRLNFSGLSYTTDTRVGINLAVVPEPATWAMLVVGFGVVGAATRRRRAVAA